MATPRLLGGRYQVGELVGYGGTGEVHRGRDVRLGRDVAIKMLRPDLFDNDEALLRLRREIRYATRLIHPNIGVISDVGEESGKDASLPYIVMEFINGRTLKEVLAAEGRLLPRRAVEMTADLASALAFVHGHGLVHSAVKPGKVMLTAHGQIKLIGFDLVRAPSGETEELEASSVIGTAAYISPEQATGGSVDARSDIYSTGCTLFALLCGRPPFLGDSPVAVAYQHVRADRPAPSTFNPDVAEAIDAIVLRTMARDPLNRYQSAQDLYADLKRVAASASAPAARRGAATRSRGLLSRRARPTPPMPADRPTGHVFISYSHASDQRYVEKLAAHLVKAGITTWFDKEIISGDRWLTTIVEKLDSCAALIVVMTPESERSSWVGKEVLRALDSATPILPLLLRGRAHFALRDLHFEDVIHGRMPSDAYVARLRSVVADRSRGHA